MENTYLHEVAITAIVRKGDTYLVTKRAATKKRFPGMWTVPGGKLETSDYLSLPKDTKDYWYNVLEKTLRREVREEVGIEIENIAYLTSLATVHGDGYPSLVISCTADYVSGEITLQTEELSEYRWVTFEEARSIELIDGILDELSMAQFKFSGKKGEWSRASM